MIYHGSRYEYEPLDRVLEADGTRHLTLFPRSASSKYNNSPWQFTQYIVHQGDRLDTLAWSFYGQPELWWLIADANPELFHPNDDLVVGHVIRIPSYRPLRRLVLPTNGNLGGIVFQNGAFSGATLR